MDFSKQNKTGGIYDDASFTGAQNSNQTVPTREKKSFLQVARNNSANHLSSINSQQDPNVRRASPQPIQQGWQQQNTQQGNMLRQAYQKKIDLHKKQEYERRIRIAQTRRLKAQAAEQRELFEKDQERQRKIALKEQKRAYQEKIAQQERLSRGDFHKTPSQRLNLTQQKITHKPAQDLAREYYSRKTQSQESLQVVREKVQISQWQNLATQGISVQKQQEKTNGQHLEAVTQVSSPTSINRELSGTDQAYFETQSEQDLLPTAKDDVLHVKTKEILTHKSDSFFENLPEAKELHESGSNSRKKIFTSVRSLFPGSKRKTRESLSAATQQKNSTLARLFPSSDTTRIGTNSVQYASFRFATFGLICLTAFGSLMFMGHALATKDRVQNSADEAIMKLQDAAGFARTGDFQRAYADVERAHELFLQADEQISTINQAVIRASRFVPGASRLSSGDALVNASVHISQSLTEITKLTADLDQLQQEATEGELNDFSMLDVSESFFEHIKVVSEQLSLAEQNIARVHIDDVPEGQKDHFIQLRRTMEPLTNILKQTVELEGPISELLGSEGTRKYLFIFQNNHEMRASGGFIGSYGFLDMNSGRIREFKIDGIYNPDGQLTDKVVPPRPIQKISAAWSLHDSNWWPDFPKSAEKAMDFYARTGGPSVDGVIAVTPVMIERLLEITGPITMPQYKLTLTADNFVDLTRNEIESNALEDEIQSKEIDRDKDQDEDEDEDEDESPKKILSDLMPILMGELKKDLSREKLTKLLSVVLGGLDQRQVMIYTRNQEVQEILESKKWGGRILSTDDDYLSVVHSNINGFKTDGVIDDLITHESQLNEDGRIINRVSVERTHNGGNTGRQWWDAVNANYMRVYVPEGSRLLSATGHTPEWHEPRLDYEALGFEIDADVLAEESDVYIDPESGTRVYSDSGKTVFGNWVYVSPGEKVTVTYEYELPWRFTTRKDESGSFSSYDILYQKQAGVQNSRLKSSIKLDQNMHIIARIPERSIADQVDKNINEYEQDFDSDLYQGVVFRIK